VNHLVIVVDNPAAGQSFPFFTDDDFHRATGLSPSARLYYLLYAGQFGSYIDNSATQNIMNRFIDAAGLLPSWPTVDPRSGTVPPGESVNLALRLDATGLEARDYQGVMAFVSNVPTMPELDVPVSLHVRGRPALGLRESSINFGTVFVGYQATRPLTILNLGTEPLVVSSMSADRGDYSAVPPSDSIAPRDSAIVQVRFAPSTDGDRTSTMTIYSNEPGYPHGATLRGAGLFPPDIATSPNVIEGFASPGQQITRIFQICNQGGSPLTFTLRISEPALSALGTTSPGGARAASLEPSRSPLRAPARGAPAAGLQSEPDLAPIAGVHAPEAALQGFDYSFLDSDMPGGPTFNWVDITGVGTRLPLTGDESIYAGVPIGFDFPFYGNKFNTLNVNVNGWVSFTSTLAPGNLNQRLPDSRSVVPKNLLAVFWDDMMFGPVERAYAYNDGGRFILSFEGISREGSAGGYTFQAILYPDGQITYQYLQLGQNVTGATVGIQNDTGTEGLTVVHNAPYLHGGLAVGISPPTSLTWARISPASGTVGVGGCADIQITLDAGLLGPGDYVAVLQVPSNDPDERLEFHDVVFHVQSPIPGDLDIDPNSLNPGRTGRWITTYLELPAPFHVTDLDLPTVRLNGSIAPDTSHQTVGDHDYDGIPDLTLKFDRGATQQILPEADSVDIVVTGQMTSGGLFTSNDRIRLIRHTVLAPNGGERLTAGGSATIRWSVPSTWHPDYAALFYSRDDGATWAPIAQNVPGLSFIWSVPDQVCTAARVRVNLFDADGLIAHDSSDGPFSIEPAALAVEPGEVQAFALRQNTPNPFRVSTRIEFDLPVASHVRLKIFDTAGRAVHTLVDGFVPAGRHGVRWDGRSGSGQSLHPGVYLLRIETPGFTATRRMVLID
jgi:hypothetical protein